MQTEDAGVKSSHPHFKFKKGNDMNDTMTKGNAAALLPIGVFLLIFLGAGIAFGDFYAMPAVVAFLIALFVAFMQNRQQKFADKIGADSYTANAVEAVKAAKEMLNIA